ncbi:hypothetical protein PoB_004012700 [Plakobranchus ocellatus]|uniref:Uncharacterized protein n=1 Tax=Plakobranchus ocellatus TaxID=259542 RepID=A0AAV4B3A6_9GAST|nr:hypothetical protein PoB_004012700 [Plakobranchus ocellatus]
MQTQYCYWYLTLQTGRPDVWLGLGVLHTSAHPFSTITQLLGSTVPDTPYMCRSCQRKAKQTLLHHRRHIRLVECKMPEQELNSTASKFISSLIKSLQIICNGHVDFNESIELIGHINVRIDSKFKYDYIVDEHVSKEGEDCSTTFLSNSYHSHPPPRATCIQNDHTQPEQDLSLSTLPAGSYKSQQSQSSRLGLPVNDGKKTEEASHRYNVNVDTQKAQDFQENQMVFKLEEDESNECMMLPTSADNYEPLDDVDDAKMKSSSSIGPECAEDSLGVARTRKRQKLSGQGSPDKSTCSENSVLREAPQLANSVPKKLIEEEKTNTEVCSFDSENHLKEFKDLIAKLAAMCNIPVLQDELYNIGQNRGFITSGNEIKAAKKRFLEKFDKEKLKKMKEVLKMKKGKQKKLRLKTLLAESGLSNEQLLLLAQDSTVYRRKISWKTMPDGPDKEAMLKAHKKSTRLRTQERQQRLLEMAEMLKRNQTNDPGMTIISKDGGKKCTLHKSSVSVVSHNTHQLFVDNIDDVAEALTGKTTKALLIQNKTEDKSKEKIKIEQNRKTCIKKKMKQIIGKILAEVTDAGYRVLVTSTIGSEAGSHSSELSVVPLKVDDFFPETKESEVKPELTEEEYAKQLEREQIIEKQKINEDKMKEIESKLIRILSGAEEIYIPTRKRYSPGEPRPSDAERMKEYRKRLKQDPEKYQVYKQKRAMNKKWRKLGQLAAKVKVNASGATLTVIPASGNEEVHSTQSMGTIVNINPPVGNVNMHCPQVFEHPSSHQPSASVVNVHHTNQYVGQVSGMHATHQQPITYGNEMEFVELIAATHNVQNQHFG